MPVLIQRLASAGLVAIVAGCGNSPPPTPNPTAAQPSASAETSPLGSSGANPTEATETAAPAPSASDAQEFQVDSVVSVVEGPLRVRSRPRVADDSQLLNPLLDTGQKLFVLAGPERASGYDWYLVYPFLSDAFVAGWVAAAARDGTPWLEPTTVPCLQNPSLEDLSVMDHVQQVACYGRRGLASGDTSRDFTFTDRIYWGPMCGDGGDWNGPEWMGGCLSTFYWGIKDRGVILAIPPHLADSAGPPPDPYDAVSATVTAHLDDPAATECSFGGYEIPDDPELAHAGAVVDCRSFFVASSFVRH